MRRRRPARKTKREVPGITRPATPFETQQFALGAAHSSIRGAYATLATVFSHAVDLEDEFVAKLASELYCAIHDAETNVEHAIRCHTAMKDGGQ